MLSSEFLLEKDLVNARGQLLRVAIDFNWRMVINGGGADYEPIGEVESLIFMALESRCDKLVSDEKMTKALFEANEVAVSYGMSPNLLLDGKTDHTERFITAIGGLLLRGNPLSDNIFNISGHRTNQWFLMVSNFDDITPENDKRQEIIDSVSDESLSSDQITGIDSSLSREYRIRVRRAETIVKIENLSQAEVTEPELIVEHKDSPQVSTSANVRSVPQPKSNSSQGYEVKTPIEVIEKKPTTPVDKPRPRPIKNSLFTDPKVYAGDLYQRISELPPGGSGLSIELIKGYLRKSEHNPDSSGIEQVLGVAISKRLIKSEINSTNPKVAGDIVYYRI